MVCQNCSGEGLVYGPVTVTCPECSGTGKVEATLPTEETSTPSDPVQDQQPADQTTDEDQKSVGPQE